MPKDFDPSKKPDPERWLPLQERSSYKPNKKKKGKGRGGEGDRDRTQGGISEKQPEKGGQVVGGGSGGGGKNKGGKKKGKR